MQLFSKLHLFAVLSSMLAVNLTLAAPLSTSSLDLMERSDAIDSNVYSIDAADAAALEMEEDFSISDFANKIKSVANKVKSGVKQVATIAKPIVDTAANLAQYTPLAPEANIVHKVVDKAANL
ncbi:hypothetical protein CVT25_008069 [Psilocybe cyanescens]|uniref:Uncharacterized protein n=1 Tax=Psilocybe cyanescens TaxID=93625 RepID=A0A409XGA0_PSICY|nr:hypothetical protein CVT25_008069 [Psilocybe cyanescens]